jgi:hypothetical protein
MQLPVATRAKRYHNGKIYLTTDGWIIIPVGTVVKQPETAILNCIYRERVHRKDERAHTHDTLDAREFSGVKPDIIPRLLLGPVAFRVVRLH